MRLQQPPIHLVVICFAFAANVHRSKTLRLSNERNVQQDLQKACPARELWPPYFSEPSRGKCDTTMFDIKLVRRKDESIENREYVHVHRESKGNRCDLELNSKTTARLGVLPAESRSETVDSRNTGLPNIVRQAEKDTRFNTKERRDQNSLVRGSENSKRYKVTRSQYFQNNLRGNDLTDNSERSVRNSGNTRGDNTRTYEPRLGSENNRRQDSQRHLSLRRIDHELLANEQPVISARREQQRITRSDKLRHNQIEDHFRITREQRTSEKRSGNSLRMNGDRKMQEFQLAAKTRGLDSRIDDRKINRRLNLQEIGRQSRSEENGQHERYRRNIQRFEERASNSRIEENMMGDRRNGQSIEKRIGNSRMDERTLRISNLMHSERIEVRNGNARVEAIMAHERRIDPRTQRRTNILDLQESMVGSHRNARRVERRERITRVDESKISERIDGQRFKRQIESRNMEERRINSRINDRRVSQKIDGERMEQRRINERRKVQRFDRNHENTRLDSSAVDNHRGNHGVENNQRRSEQGREMAKQGELKNGLFERQTDNGRMERKNERFRLAEQRNERFKRGMTMNSRSQEQRIDLLSRPRELQKGISTDREQRRSSENRINYHEGDTTNSKQEIRTSTSRNSMPNRIFEQLLSTNSINREMGLRSYPRSIEQKSQPVERRRSLTDSMIREVRTQSSSRSFEQQRSLSDSINREVRIQSRSIDREIQALEQQQRYLTDSVSRELRMDSRSVHLQSHSRDQQRSSSVSINREVRKPSLSRSIERQSLFLDQQRSLADSRTRSLDRQQSRSLEDRYSLTAREIRMQFGSSLREQPSRHLAGSLGRQLQMGSRSFEQSRSVERRRLLTDSVVREEQSQSHSILVERQSRSLKQQHSLLADSFDEDVRKDFRSQSIDRQSRSLEQRRCLTDDVVRKVRMQTRSRLMERESRSVEQQHSMADKMNRNVRTESRSKANKWPSRSVEQHSLRDTMNREVRMQSCSRSSERKSRSAEQRRSLTDTMTRDARMQFRSSLIERQTRSVEHQRSLTDKMNRDVQTESRSKSTERQFHTIERSQAGEQQRSRTLEQQRSLKDSLRQLISISIEWKSRSLRQGRSLKYSMNREMNVPSRSRSIENKLHTFERRCSRDVTNRAVRQEFTKSVVQLQSKTLAQRGSMKSSSTLFESTLPTASVTSMVSEKNDTEMTKNHNSINGEQTSERYTLKRLALINFVKTSLWKIVNTFVQNWQQYNTMDMKVVERGDSNMGLEGIIAFSSKKLTHFTEIPEQVSTINGIKLRSSWPEQTTLPWTGAVLALTLLIQPMGKRIKT